MNLRFLFIDSLIFLSKHFLSSYSKRSPCNFLSIAIQVWERVIVPGLTRYAETERRQMNFNQPSLF